MKINISNTIKNSNSLKNSNCSSSRTTVGSNMKRRNISKIEKVDKSVEFNINEIKNIFIRLRLKRVKSQNNIIIKRLMPMDSFKKKENSFSKEYYKGMNLNRAPSLYSNRKSINQIINKNKIIKNNEYQNFYSNIKINSSRLSRNNIGLKEDKPIKENNSNIKKLNISDIIEYNHKKRNNNISHNYSSEDSKINSISANRSEIFNNSKSRIKEIKNLKKIVPNIISYKEKCSLSSNRNEKNKNSVNNNSVLLTLLPIIPYSKRNKLLNSYSINENNTNKKYKDINLSNFEINKIERYIFEIINNKSKSSKQFSSLESHIIKIKYYQHLQEQNLIELLKTEKFNIPKKLEHFKKLFNIVNNIWRK